MRESFISHKIIGELYIIDVLVHYDYPRVFICEDKFNLKYYFTESESASDYDKWLVFKLSNHRYFEILRGEKGFKDIVVDSEDKDYKIITKDYSNDTVQIEQLDYLDESLIPRSNDTLSRVDSNDLEMSLIEESYTKDEPIFDLRLFPGNERVHDMEYGAFKRILTSTREFLKVFNKDLKLRVSTQAGSFIIRFNLGGKRNLFTNQEAFKTIESVQNALALNNNTDVWNYFSQDLKSIKKYTNFVNTLNKVDSDFEVISSNPEKVDIKRRRYTRSEINYLSTTLGEFYTSTNVEEHYRGVLVAVDVTKSSFSISTDDGLIKGKINDSIDVDSYEIPCNCEVKTITKLTISADNETISKKEYFLTELVVLE